MYDHRRSHVLLRCLVTNFTSTNECPILFDMNSLRSPTETISTASGRSLFFCLSQNAVCVFNSQSNRFQQKPNELGKKPSTDSLEKSC